MLADNRFDILHESRTYGGVTPLMAAIQGGNIFVVGECLNNGMNPFATDRLGQSALEYAAPFQNVNGQDMRELIRQARQ